jgi:hypothetical protein
MQDIRNWAGMVTLLLKPLKETPEYSGVKHEDANQEDLMLKIEQAIRTDQALLLGNLLTAAAASEKVILQMTLEHRAFECLRLLLKPVGGRYEVVLGDQLRLRLQHKEAWPLLLQFAREPENLKMPINPNGLAFVLSLGMSPETQIEGKKILLEAALAAPMPDNKIIETVQTLLQYGANPNAPTSTGRSLLNMAHSTEVTQLLLEKGAVQDPSVFLS